MKELNISSTQKNPRINSANDRQYRYYPNVLNRNFETKAPNTIWVSDITYAKFLKNIIYQFNPYVDNFQRQNMTYMIKLHIPSG